MKVIITITIVMKAIISLFLFQLLIFTSSDITAQVNKFAMDEKFGFRNIKLETPLQEFKDLIKLSGNEGVLLFELKNEDLALGDLQLKGVIYVFYDSLLSGIMIRTDGKTNSKGLLNILQQKYDVGNKLRAHIEEYLWESDKMVISFNLNGSSGEGLLLLQSKKLMESMERRKKEKLQEAANSAF